MRRGKWASDPSALLASSHNGAIRVAALAGLGVPPRTTYRRCTPDGPWQRLLPGVVLLGSLPPTRRQLVAAASLYAGSGSVVTGLEACRQHGLRKVPDDHRVHLLVPHERRVISNGYVLIERTKRMPRPVIHDSVPLAPLTRSVLDACRRFRGLDPTRALIADGIQRRRLSLQWLTDELEVGSQRGTAVPRAVLREFANGARSVAEIDATQVWQRAGLPPPAWNVVLRNAHGQYVAMPDAWFAIGLAWEIDSYEFHFHREGYADTINRNARYAAAGVTVLQTLPSRLRDDPIAVIAELTAAYQAAAARPRPEVTTS